MRLCRLYGSVESVEYECNVAIFTQRMCQPAIPTLFLVSLKYDTYILEQLTSTWTRDRNICLKKMKHFN